MWVAGWVFGGRFPGCQTTKGDWKKEEKKGRDMGERGMSQDGWSNFRFRSEFVTTPGYDMPMLSRILFWSTISYLYYWNVRPQYASFPEEQADVYYYNGGFLPLYYIRDGVLYVDLRLLTILLLYYSLKGTGHNLKIYGEWLMESWSDHLPDSSIKISLHPVLSVTSQFLNLQATNELC